MGVKKNDRDHTHDPVPHGDPREMNRHYCIRRRLAEEIVTWIGGMTSPSF
jgi:hypothetical protein